MPAKNDFVESYQKQVGVKDYSDFKYFVKYVTKKYGWEKANELLQAIDQRAQGNIIDIYPLLHESLELSIDFLSFQSSLHKSYMRWLSRQELQPPNKVLDIGCGNGYLACFYAKKFPESKVIGIDKCPQAVSCANELALKLDLHNVHFEVADITSADLSVPSPPFDLVTAVTTFNDAVDIPDPDQSPPLRRALKNLTESAEVNSLKTLAGLLTPSSGIFVSLERWGKLNTFAWWVFAIQNAGLIVDYQESGYVLDNLMTKDQPRKVPVLVSRLASATGGPNLDGVISFWLYGHFLKEIGKLKTFDFQQDLAQEAFAFINPKRFRLGVKGVFNHDLVTRFEIWQAGSFILFIRFTTDGRCSLEVLPSITYEQVVEHLNESADSIREHGEVSFYSTPEILWDEGIL